MAKEEARIEALEHQLMRSWIDCDGKAVKSVLAGKFRLVLGASTPVLLDRKSLVDAVPGRWRVSGYRFGNNIYSRAVGTLSLFATEVELDMAIEGRDCSGRWWQADVWKRGGIAQRWQLLDRQLARTETGHEISQLVRNLQLWR